MSAKKLTIIPRLDQALIRSSTRARVRLCSSWCLFILIFSKLFWSVRFRGTVELNINQSIIPSLDWRMRLLLIDDPATWFLARVSES